MCEVSSSSRMKKYLLRWLCARHSINVSSSILLFSRKNYLKIHIFLWLKKIVDLFKSDLIFKFITLKLKWTNILQLTNFTELAWAQKNFLENFRPPPHWLVGILSWDPGAVALSGFWRVRWTRAKTCWRECATRVLLINRWHSFEEWGNVHSPGVS